MTTWNKISPERCESCTWILDISLAYADASFDCWHYKARQIFGTLNLNLICTHCFTFLVVNDNPGAKSSSFSMHQKGRRKPMMTKFYQLHTDELWKSIPERWIPAESNMCDGSRTKNFIQTVKEWQRGKPRPIQCFPASSLSNFPYVSSK